MGVVKVVSSKVCSIKGLKSALLKTVLLMGALWRSVPFSVVFSKGPHKDITRGPQFLSDLANSVRP